MCRGVLPDVLAVRVAHLAGYPVADFVVAIVVLVFGVEGGGHLVVCLYELVDGVGQVVLGVGDLAVDVVGAALGVRVFLVVCFWVIGGEPLLVPAVLDTGFRRYDVRARLIMGAGFQIPAFFTLTLTVRPGTWVTVRLGT